MYIANVGDSRAVTFKNGFVTRVSLDHKPDLPEEEVSSSPFPFLSSVLTIIHSLIC
jgi:serine/threonine protein phosphatase PrpC